MTNPEAKSPPAGGLTDDIAEQLDLLVACAKPASGQNSARVAAGLVRDYIADLIRERDQAAATADRLERMANTRVDMAAYHEAKQARRADDATADRDRLALLLSVSQPSGEEIPPDMILVRRSFLEEVADKHDGRLSYYAVRYARDVLSSGSNKSDDGKKGQTG